MTWKDFSICCISPVFDPGAEFNMDTVMKTNFRGNMVTALVSLLTGLFCGCQSTGEVDLVAASPSSAERPNFLFIAVDDLNHYTSFLIDQEGHFLSKVYPDEGHRREIASRLTPNLTRLAGQSMVFSRAYCPQAVCGPSRAAILGGIPPHISGYTNHLEHFRYNEMLKDVVTLPQFLRGNGYQTIGLGKIYHKHIIREELGRRQDWPDTEYSWDTWIERNYGIAGPNGRSRIHSPYSPTEGQFQFGLNELPVEETWDYLNVEFAADLYMTGKASLQDFYGLDHTVELNPGKPFFLACGLLLPHLPWFVQQEFYDRFPVEEIQYDDELVEWIRNDITDLPQYAIEHFLRDDFERIFELGEKESAGRDGLRAALQAYLASIAYADHCLGKLIDAIEQSPHRDNTVVVLWSDHGWHLGDKYRYQKQALWDPANHSVLMVRDPRYPLASSGSKCEAIVSLQSLYPTLVERADFAVPDHVHGHSLQPLLENPSAEWKHPALMSFGEGNNSLRTAQWRYIRYADGGEELYDMINDPFEYTNLAQNPNYAQARLEMEVLLEKTLSLQSSDFR